jgi:SAM-dependent methyltransferase
MTGSTPARSEGEPLADAAYWDGYWAGRRPRAVGRHFYYGKLLDRALRGRPYRTFIELGGFPGSFAVYVTRRFGYRATLLDSHVDSDALADFLRTNGLGPDAIDVVEGDLFELALADRFDVVLSAGLIEHFADVRPILERHLAFLAPGGTLVVTVPNLRGINGRLQARFDPDSLAVHNLAIMDPAVLERLLRELGLASVEAFYYGRFRVWLEGLSEYPLAVRALVVGLRAAGTIFDVLGIESRLTSPHIAVIAGAAAESPRQDGRGDPLDAEGGGGSERDDAPGETHGEEG